MPAYVLEPRQDALFNSVVHLWKPNPDVTDANRRVIEGFTYPVTPTYSSVRCRLQPKSEASKPAPYGRSNYDIMVTTDLLRLHMDQEVDDGWLVQLQTPGHPEIGTYFATQGGTQTYDRRAKTKVIQLKRVIKPKHKDV